MIPPLNLTPTVFYERDGWADSKPVVFIVGGTEMNEDGTKYLVRYGSPLLPLRVKLNSFLTTAQRSLPEEPTINGDLDSNTHSNENEP